MYASNWSVWSFAQAFRPQEDQKFKQNALQTKWVMVHPLLQSLVEFLDHMNQFAVLLGNT